MNRARITAGTAPEPDAGPNLRLARTLGTLAGLTSYVAFARTLTAESMGTRVLAVSLCAIPFLVARVTRGSGERIWRVAIVAQVLPLFFFPEKDLGLVFSGAIVLAIGNLIVYAGRERVLLALLVSSPTAALLEMARTPGEFWLAALPLTLVCALVGWMLFSASKRRAWLDRRLSPRLPRPRPGATTGRLLVSGVGIAVAILALAPFLYLPLLALPRPLVDEGSRQLPAPPPTSPEPGLEASQGAAQTETRFQGSFPSELDFAGGVTRLADEDVIEVRPVPPRNLGPIYLRGVVLDTISTHGASFAGPMLPGRVTDTDDGVRDGWTRLDRDPGELQLDLRVRPIGIGSTLSTVLFSPRPTHAVELPAVLHDPDGFLLLPRRTPEDQWLEYRVHASGMEPAPRPDELASLERFLQLPDEPDAIRWLRTYAREVVGGTGTRPLARVQAVVGHFKKGFEYSLHSSDFPGLQGVLDFLSSRSGHCSYFAASATLLLRIEGIPTRIATGFLAQEWLPDEGRYEVTTRDGHAWIEAYVEGRWRTFEPTPGQARSRALASAQAGSGDSLFAVGSSVLENLRRWLTSGDEYYLRMFWMEFQALCAYLFSTPAGLGLVLSCLVLLGLPALRRRTQETSRARPRPGGPRPASSLYQELLASLRALGHEKRSAQTLREFLSTVMASDPGRFSGLAEIGEDLYRARWGQEPTPGERQEAARRYLRTLRASPPEPDR